MHARPNHYVKSQTRSKTVQTCTNNALKFQNCGRVGEIIFNILHHVVVSAEMFPPKKTVVFPRRPSFQHLSIAGSCNDRYSQRHSLASANFNQHVPQILKFDTTPEWLQTIIGFSFVFMFFPSPFTLVAIEQRGRWGHNDNCHTVLRWALIGARLLARIRGLPQ